jgi:hypothetical protein
MDRLAVVCQGQADPFAGVRWDRAEGYLDHTGLHARGHCGRGERDDVPTLTGKLKAVERTCLEHMHQELAAVFLTRNGLWHIGRHPDADRQSDVRPGSGTGRQSGEGKERDCRYV